MNAIGRLAWDAIGGGAFWTDVNPGDRIKVWIVDMDGSLLFIEAATHPDLGLADVPAKLEAEIQGIVDSVRFE